MFANESSQEVYSIAIDLMTQPVNTNYSPRQRYIHESNMFALHLSYKITCAMSFTGDNCDTPGEGFHTVIKDTVSWRAGEGGRGGGCACNLLFYVFMLKNQTNFFFCIAINLYYHKRCYFKLN